MAKPSENGQVVIEAAVVALLLVGMFLLAVTIAETGHRAQQSHRFASKSRSR